MRLLFTVLVLFTGVLLDGVLAGLDLPGGSPSALLVIVVALGVAYGRQPGAYAGFAAGLAVDLIPPGGPVLGRAALVLCLVGYLAGTARRVPSSRTAIAVLVVVSSVLAALLSATVSEVLGTAVPWGAVAALLPTTVAYNLVLTPIVGFLVLRIARKLEPRSYRTTRWSSGSPALSSPTWSAGRR